MTMLEKIKMYKGKKAFIKNISKAFEEMPAGTTVESINYEVYRKEINENKTYFAEYLIVNFIGGGKAVKLASGNSNTANFRALGNLVDGGYYDEVQDYETILDRGFAVVNLSDTGNLDNFLSEPLTHITNIYTCFEHCRNYDDIKRVINSIPTSFGTFALVDYSDSGENDTFIIRNDYEENGDILTEEIEYDFYTEET